MIKENIKFRHWYRDSRDAIEQRYGEHSDLFCDILAATSPRKHVRANYRTAHAIIEAVLDGREYPKRGLMPNHTKNIDRVLAGQELSGNKVWRFARNLRGDLQCVTVDIWMLRYLNEPGTNLTDRQYAALEARCQRNAANHNLEPAEYQAIAWVVERKRWGFRPVSFASVMEIDQTLMPFMEVV